MVIVARSWSSFCGGAVLCERTISNSPCRILTKILEAERR